jgi:hypothetical protein
MQYAIRSKQYAVSNILLMSTLDVSSVLSLDVLKDARLVAGAGGLSRPIRWVHIVDIPDVVEWVQEGDLLLTATALISSKNSGPPWPPRGSRG